MEQKKYVTYQQMEDFIRNYPDKYDTAAVFQDAVRYFENSSMLREYFEPFSLERDIILTPDDEFERLCDKLPVNIIFPVNTAILQSENLFPPNYECYIIRHLNSLAADWHDHDFFELCYVWSGSCVQTVSERTYALEEGDFLILPPGMVHRIDEVSAGSVIFNVMVRTRTFSASLSSIMMQNNPVSVFFRRCLLQDNKKSCLSVHTDNSLFLKRIIKHLCQECYVEPEVFCDFAYGIFYQLLGFLMLNGEVMSESMDMPGNFAIFNILRNIRQNYATVTLKSLAGQYYFTQEHLSRLIRKHTGRTYTQILRDVRMEQAKLLLTRTSEGMEQIGNQLGYHDTAAFFRTFKQTEGITPAQYRRINS